MDKFSVFVCMLMMDVNLKTKDSMYIIYISIFGGFFSEEKSVHYTWTNKVMLPVLIVTC